jgi:SAM-dependent methyltransferase
MLATEATQLPTGVPDEWLEDHLATVFSKWHQYISEMQRDSQRLLIEAADIQRNDTVLDLACGSGIPALKIAETVGPVGRVMAVDPSPIFLEAVAENARAQGLANVQPVRGSGEYLPFEPGSFDAVTSHMGVMFFLNLNAGLTAIRQVLKRGKRAAFAAWGPLEENAYFRPLFSVMGSILPPPPPPDPSLAPEDIPQAMRFAAPGSLSRALSAAGFNDVRESLEPIELHWPGPATSATEMFLELSQALEKIPAEQHEATRAKFVDALSPYEVGGELRMPAKIVIASGAA